MTALRERIRGVVSRLAVMERDRDEERARANEWLTQLHDATRERDEIAERARRAAQILIDCIGSNGGPESVDGAAARAVEAIFHEQAAVSSMRRNRDEVYEQRVAAMRERDEARADASKLAAMLDREACVRDEHLAALRDLVGRLESSEETIGQRLGERAETLASDLTERARGSVTELEERVRGMRQEIEDHGSQLVQTFHDEGGRVRDDGHDQGG